MTSQRSRSINAAIECNHIGIELFKKGFIVESLGAFQFGQRILEPVIQSMRYEEIMVNATSATPSTNFYIPALFDNNINEQLIQQSLVQCWTTYEECRRLKDIRRVRDMPEKAFMFLDPIVLNEVGDEATSCIIEYASIVLNMALTYHYYGSEPSLAKALHLFESALRLAQGRVHDQRCETIIMASLNNISHIYHIQENYKLSNHYRKTLGRFVQSLPETCDPGRKEKRSQFFLNAVLFLAPKAAKAA